MVTIARHTSVDAGPRTSYPIVHWQLTADTISSRAPRDIPCPQMPSLFFFLGVFRQYMLIGIFQLAPVHMPSLFSRLAYFFRIHRRRGGPGTTNYLGWAADPDTYHLPSGKCSFLTIHGSRHRPQHQAERVTNPSLPSNVTGDSCMHLVWFWSSTSASLHLAT